ncbi:MAG: VWA domain-containing protein [Gammaproteobacteria bacterium]|nr:VWA domain-containing protein [Gammaproteobacteria bacterium]
MSEFQFAQPGWLWLLLFTPLWLIRDVSQRRARWRQLTRFADPHLLPSLLVDGRGSSLRSRHSLWPLLWLFGVLAMAGPRWDYRQVETYRPAGAAVILLDLSRSMDVTDVAPSRLERARQEISDLVSSNPDLRLGLVAFAAVPHVVAPVTEDMATLLNLLPAMKSGLVERQGTDLIEALRRCKQLLAVEAGGAKSVLLLSDGEYPETDLGVLSEELRALNIRLHVLGLGTPEGGPIPTPGGEWFRDQQGNPVISRLNESNLQQLAEAAGGIYRRADYRQDDTRALLQALATSPEVGEVSGHELKLWHERFYIFLIPFMLLLLSRFRQIAPLPVEPS